jgi:hypothetical protein
MRNDQPDAKSWVMDGETGPAEVAGVWDDDGSFLGNHAAAGGRERLPVATCREGIRKSGDAGKFLFRGRRIKNHWIHRQVAKCGMF